MVDPGGGMSAPGGGCLVRGVCSWGGCLVWGWVSAPGGCLVRGVCSWGGGCLVWGWVSAPGGCLVPGGGIPACTEADPPVDRMTDTCKNITFATSLRTVMITPEPPVNHGIPYPLASDIWWWSLETCLNLFIWGPTLLPPLGATSTGCNWNIQFPSRWYASYWNAFLFWMNVHHYGNWSCAPIITSDVARQLLRTPNFWSEVIFEFATD